MHEGKKSQTEARLARRIPISIANHLNFVPKTAKKKRERKKEKKKTTHTHRARFSSSEFSSFKPCGRLK